MQCKYENATNQLNDLKYEVEKGIAREEKLECQLIEVTLFCLNDVYIHCIVFTILFLVETATTRKIT